MSLTSADYFPINYGFENKEAEHSENYLNIIYGEDVGANV
jgi:hypothetical protein